MRFIPAVSGVQIPPLLPQICQRAPRLSKRPWGSLFFVLPVGALHQRRGQAGSTPKTALHQRRGQAPSTGSFSDRFLNNSPSISAAQYAHPQAVIFEVAEAIRSPLNQLHFSMETFCNAVIPSKTEHSGHFFPPIMQRLAQCAQRREGCFSKLIDFIQ